MLSSDTTTIVVILVLFSAQVAIRSANFTFALHVWAYSSSRYGRPI